MTSSRSAFARLFIFLAVAVSASAASARTTSIEYSVSVRGFHIGKARIDAEYGGGRYSVGFSGRAAGLARIFTDAETSAAASGTIAAGALRPAEYRHVWTEDHENETVAMRFRGGALSDFDLDPPIRHPERYVPLTPQNLSGALDPVSAFLWPAPNGIGRGLCERTLPLFDGKRRFDIALSYSRLADFATRDRAYSGRVLVCSLHYRAVAGQRVDRPDKESIQDSDGMEVWLAPAGDGLAVPVRIQLNTRAGRMLMQATTITNAE